MNGPPSPSETKQLQRAGKLLKVNHLSAYHPAGERAEQQALELLSPCKALRERLLNLDLDRIYHPGHWTIPSPYPLVDQDGDLSFANFALRATASVLNKVIGKASEYVMQRARSYVDQAVGTKGQGQSEILLCGVAQLFHVNNCPEPTPEGLPLIGPANYIQCNVSPHRTTSQATWRFLAEPHALVVVFVQSKITGHRQMLMGYTLPSQATTSSIPIRLHDRAYLVSHAAVSPTSPTRLLPIRSDHSAFFLRNGCDLSAYTFHISFVTSLLPIEHGFHSVMEFPICAQKALLLPLDCIFLKTISVESLTPQAMKALLQAVKAYTLDDIQQEQIVFCITFMHFIIARSARMAGSSYHMLDSIAGRRRPKTLAYALVFSKISAITKLFVQQARICQPRMFGSADLDDLVRRVTNAQIAVTAHFHSNVVPAQSIHHTAWIEALKQPTSLRSHPYCLAAPFLLPEAENELRESLESTQISAKIAQKLEAARGKADEKWLKTGRTIADPAYAAYVKDRQEKGEAQLREQYGYPPALTQEELLEQVRSSERVRILGAMAQANASCLLATGTGSKAETICIPEDVVEALNAVDLFSNSDYIHCFPMSDFRSIAKAAGSTLNETILVVNDVSQMNPLEVATLVKRGRGVVFSGTSMELESVLRP